MPRPKRFTQEFTLWISPEQRKRLDTEWIRTGLSVSALIRLAIDKEYPQTPADWLRSLGTEDDNG